MSREKEDFIHAMFYLGLAQRFATSAISTVEEDLERTGKPGDAEIANCKKELSALEGRLKAFEVRELALKDQEISTEASIIELKSATKAAWELTELFNQLNTKARSLSNEVNPTAAHAHPTHGLTTLAAGPESAHVAAQAAPEAAAPELKIPKPVRTNPLFIALAILGAILMTAAAGLVVGTALASGVFTIPAILAALTTMSPIAPAVLAGAGALVYIFNITAVDRLADKKEVEFVPLIDPMVAKLPSTPRSSTAEGAVTLSNRLAVSDSPGASPSTVVDEAAEIRRPGSSH